MHSQSDFSKRRSSIIREARKSKASSQGYAQKQLACAAAAAAPQALRKEDVQCNSKEVATWESRAGTRDETRDATGVEKASGNSWRTASTADVDTDLREQEVTADALLKNEANTQEMERVKIGSNKICIREDLAKDEMIFSEKSSRAIFEMGNVELIEVKKTSIQCPSCLHHVFEGTFTCMCGKIIRPCITSLRVRLLVCVAKVYDPTKL